jgi:cytochrome c oxidase cbb3-type subunit 3
MRGKRRLYGVALLVAFAATPARALAQSKAAIDQGKLLFNGMCVECHGAGGAGGDAPSLNRARLSHARDEAALANVISNGIPNTAMPRIRRFTENETRELVAYVRSLGKAAEAKVPGDAKKGGDIYKSLGCATCHILSGQGGNLGPDLTEIGFMRGAAYLRQAVVDPGATLPKGVLPVLSRGYAEYLPVRIVTKQGSEVRGIRVNEDAFTIQVRDEAGKFYSLRKSDLELLDKETGKSLMPSFATRLTAPQLTDLVAYLVSLRGAE